MHLYKLEGITYVLYTGIKLTTGLVSLGDKRCITVLMAYCILYDAICGGNGFRSIKHTIWYEYQLQDVIRQILYNHQLCII